MRGTEAETMWVYLYMAALAVPAACCTQPQPLIPTLVLRLQLCWKKLFTAMWGAGLVNCSTFETTFLLLFMFNLDPFSDPAHSLKKLLRQS